MYALINGIYLMNEKKQPLKVFWKNIFKSSYQKCSIKKMFLQISQNSLQKSVPDLSCRPQSGTLLKKRLWQRNFPVNFAKFLRTSFLQNTFGRLLLDILQNICSTEYQFGYMIKIFKKCQWRSPFFVKLQAYSLQL